MEKKLKIGVAEDHDILSQSMSKLLLEEDNIGGVYEASNGLQLMGILESTSLDVVILDLNMPVMDGRETLKNIQKLDEEIKPGVIILSMYNTIEHVRKYIGEGANAYLSKGCDYQELLSAIYNVHDNGYHFDYVVTRELVTDVIRKSSSSTKYTIDTPLSQREIEVLRLICKEKKSIEISDQLGISLRTVENHRLHIMKKIGARNSVGLIIYAIKNGLMDIEQL